MTRLDLAVMLREESGVSGSGPTSTVSQSGEYKMLVGWMDRAYNRIQLKHRDWKFLRNDFSRALTSGTSEYTASATGSLRHRTWITDDVRCYLTATGVSDEQDIFFMPWADFKRTYLFGSARTQTGRPSYFTVKPDDSLVFWPVPDDSYTVVGEYYVRPVDWSEESDPDNETPVFPEQFHELVVWGALKFYGANYVEHDKYVHGQNEYRNLIELMEQEQRPQMGWGGPLA